MSSGIPPVKGTVQRGCVLEGRIRDEVSVSEIPVADFDVVAGFAGLLRRDETSAESV